MDAKAEIDCICKVCMDHVIKCILRPDVSSVIAVIYKFQYTNMSVHHDISHDGCHIMVAIANPLC